MSNILKISDAASIALHAIIIIAQQKDELISVKKISQILNISSNHLSKVLQKMVKANIIVSIKGYNGGFKIVKDPAKLTLLDIYESIDGEFKPNSCLLHRANLCDDCIMGDCIKSVNKQIKDYFKKTTIKDIMTKKKF